MTALPATRVLQSLWRAARDPAFRRDLLWRKLPRPAGVFQISGDTKDNRYPDIFRFVQRELGQQDGLRLLSFGCSTGEEVFALRDYFPSATIDGIDINPYRIRAAGRRLRQRGGDPGLHFSVAPSPSRLAGEAYDAIFCMAVFRHGGLQLGPPARCDHLIRFAAFEHVVAHLARSLRPGGFLAIAFSNFRFSDTQAAARFEPVMRMANAGADPATPLYDAQDRLLPTGTVYQDVLFRKHPA